jgi:hypothetical protein
MCTPLREVCVRAGSKEEKLRELLKSYGAVESLGWWSLRF